MNATCALCNRLKDDCDFVRSSQDPSDRRALAVCATCVRRTPASGIEQRSRVRPSSVQIPRDVPVARPAESARRGAPIEMPQPRRVYEGPGCTWERQPDADHISQRSQRT